jgi:hypothetical protein
MYRPRPEHDRDQECGFSYSHEPADGSDRPLPVTELALRMDGLTKSDDDSEARARSAEATVFLSYADLSDALGLELTRGYGSDRIRARVLTTLGFEVTATTTVSAASGNRITFQGLQGRGPRRPARGRREVARPGLRRADRAAEHPRRPPTALGHHHGAGPHRPLLRRVGHLPPRRRPGHLVERVGRREIRCRGPEEP